MRSFFRTSCLHVGSFALVPFLGALACSSASDRAADGVASVDQAVNPGDDLVDAFATYQAQVAQSSLDKPFRIGYGPHPGLNTESLTGATGFPAKGQAILDFDANRVTATLDDVP